MKEISKKELKDYVSSGYLTVGEMKKILAQHDYPDDAIVVVERVKDIYYEEKIGHAT